MASLEHVNVTVKDPEATAKRFADLFDWHIRWKGTAIHSGTTYHVGNETSYVAVYSGPDGEQTPPQNNYRQLGGLNHIGVVVDDLDAVEARVKAAGYEPHSHADYEPGRRFYFHDADGIEIEVVSYA